MLQCISHGCRASFILEGDGDGLSAVKCNTTRRICTCSSCVNSLLCLKAMALITSSWVRPNIHEGDSE
jgi:hypothetical protein